MAAYWMNSPDLLICAGDARRKIELFGREMEIRLISAYDAAICVKESLLLENKLVEKGIVEAKYLAHNACLCALCLYDGLGRVLENGDEALIRLTADEILMITAYYGELRRADFDVDSLDGDDIDQLKNRMECSALSRIKWKVLKTLHRLPSENPVKNMTDGQYLSCYVNLLLDEND